MIVWLNGAFGVGKTSAAGELRDVLPQGRLHDPERLGWLLQRTVGRWQPGDYQHLSSWRRGTVWLAGRAARSAGTTLVVPMSVLRPAYLDELLSGLRQRGHDVHHVLLDAPAEVICARIAADETDSSAASWRDGHVEAYMTARADLTARGAVVQTADRSPREVAVLVAAAVLER